MKTILTLFALLLISSSYAQTTASLDKTTESGSISWNVGSPVTLYSSNTASSLDHVLTYSLTITSLNEGLETANFDLFPNPVSKQLVIRSSIVKLEFTLSDSNGQILETGTSNTVDFTNYACGSYLINISNVSNSINQTYKIIKQ